MYRIERHPFGFRLLFADSVPKEEMTAWAKESRIALGKAPNSFVVLVDMRTLKPLSQETKAVMEEGQRQYKTAGMKRSAVILESALVTMQFKSIAKESGIYEWERYINAAAHPDWEQLAMDWLIEGVDPDKK